MNKEEYISLKTEKIHRQLITDIANDLENADALLDELTNTDRYNEDHVFRASTETAKVFVLIHRRKFSEVINRCTHLVEFAMALHEWEILSFDYNMMANAYFMLGLYEKSLEYYYRAINTEKEHGINIILPVSYANIGLIFLNVDMYGKAIEYLKLALKYVEYAENGGFRYREKKTQNLSNIIISICQMKEPDAKEINEAYSQLMAMNVDGLEADIMYSYHVAKTYYDLWKKDYDKAKKEYVRAKELLGNNFAFKMILMCTFIEQCVKYNLDLDYYAEELLEIERLETEENPIYVAMVYHKLKEYYTLNNNKAKLKEVEKGYVAFLERNMEISQKKQFDSIQILEAVLNSDRSASADEYKNREFKLVAEEAIRNKNELQKTYNRFKMIHDIGLKLTSSTDLNEVITLIYRNIRENIPTDAFIFMAAEPENNQLRSLLSYNMGVMGSGFTISLTRKESALVKCCLNNRIVSTDDDDFRPLFENIDNGSHPPDEENMKSALFIPLSIGNKVIGAYSVQSQSVKAYKPETLDFLKELRPYLVIALNNAVHSQKLQNEIDRNKEIQEKLKEANGMLSKIAGLDALTQISNRREFTEKFHELRKEAAKSSKLVSVFMFDIDDFKKYNDTYGHFEGDEALKKVAQVINRNVIKNGGIAARFGGEEFISACIGLTAEENYALGEKIRKEILELSIENIQTQLGILSISVGIAISENGKVITKSEIMSMADEMLYEAKKTGKNKVVMKVLE